MRVGRSARQLIAWIACFAILMSTLAPVISQIFLQADPSNPWAEVCTPLGAKLVRTDDAEPTQKLPGGHLLQHCPYCSLHATGMGLPPAPASPLQLPALSFGLPELFYAAPATLHAWATAQPRAPPRLS